MKADALWKRARADLTVSSLKGEYGSLLWDHSTRVVRFAEQIAALPAVQARSPDILAIIAAALYHDAGWIVRLRDGEATWDQVLLDPVLETHREDGAAMLQKSLAKLLPPDTLARATRAVQTLNDREIDAVEGQVVTEAENLDEFGAIALWSTIRRGAASGRGVQAAIDTWRRRKEYRFWDARLKDSFRFAAVRAVAMQRLKIFEKLMEQVEAQHMGLDLSKALTGNPGLRTNEPALH